MPVLAVRPELLFRHWLPLRMLLPLRFQLELRRLEARQQLSLEEALPPRPEADFALAEEPPPQPEAALISGLPEPEASPQSAGPVAVRA